MDLQQVYCNTGTFLGAADALFVQSFLQINRQFQFSLSCDKDGGGRDNTEKKREKYFGLCLALTSGDEIHCRISH